jgi:hypothetical protein
VPRHSYLDIEARCDQFEEFPPLQTEGERRGHIQQSFARLSVEDGQDITLGGNMRVYLGREQLIGQFLGKTFGQVGLGPVDAVIPVSRAGFLACILFKDHTRDVVFLQDLGNQQSRGTYSLSVTPLKGNVTTALFTPANDQDTLVVCRYTIHRGSNNGNVPPC